MTTTFLIKNGDVVYSSATGRPLMISGVTKTRQDLQEAGEIRTLANGFGFGLDDLIGQIGDAVTTRVAISRKIRDGITAIMRLQQQFQRARRTPDELIAKLVRVVVTPIVRPNQSGTAATAFAYRFDILTVSGLTPNATPISSTGVIIP